MGMSTSVVGFKPADEIWLSMKAVWDACKAANVTVPMAVEQFFGGNAPDPAGVEVNLIGSTAVGEWKEKMCDGYEVYVDKLPKDIKIVRVYNSY